MPCGRVRTMPEALEDPQIEPRQMLIPLEDPELHGFRVIGNPIKLSDNPPRALAAPAKARRAHHGSMLDEISRNST